MDVRRSVVCKALVNVAAILVVCVTIVTSSSYFNPNDYDESQYYDDARDIVVSRRSTHPACSRCILNHADWASCSACYRRARVTGSRIPYYGFRKRSSDVPEVAEVGDAEAMVLRCCAETGDAVCCRLTASGLFGGNPSSASSWLQQQLIGARYRQLAAAEAAAAEEEEEERKSLSLQPAVCSCCDTSLYDVTCCQLKCILPRNSPFVSNT
jgi:hypothetical protein